MREIIAIQEFFNREKTCNEPKLCFEILQVDAILVQKTAHSVECKRTKNTTFIPNNSEKQTELPKHNYVLELYK